MRGSVVKRGGRHSRRGRARPRSQAPVARRREWHSGFKSRQEAEAARIEILANLQRGEHVSPGQDHGPRLSSRSEWLSGNEPLVAPSTYESYKLDVRPGARADRRAPRCNR